MNKIIIHGRLTADPIQSTGKDGKLILKFSVATDNGKGKDATFHNVVAFSPKSELIAEHFHKGKEILIEGKQEHSKYEKDGKTYYFSNIVLYSFDFCGSKNDTPKDINNDCPI